MSVSTRSAGPSTLVVEDDPRLCYFIESTLEEEGLCVVTARNQAEAVILLEQEAGLRVMITDVTLGSGPTGIDLAHLVRQRWPKIGIVVTSGRSILDCQAMPDGALFLSKPYRIRELIDILSFFEDNADAAELLTSSTDEVGVAIEAAAEKFHK